MGAMKSEKNVIVLSFEDYCVAYELLNEAFSSTLRAVPQQAIQAARAVRRLWRRHSRPVNGREVAKRLRWKEGVAYKYLKAAEERGLVKRVVASSRRDNIKPYVPGRVAAKFLPSPQTVLDANAELGRDARYHNPITGKRVVLRRRTSRRAKR